MLQRLIFLIFFMSNNYIHSQQSIIEKSPRKALIYSSVIPGLGQIYNRQIIKVPIIYFSIGTSLYFGRQNQEKYLKYKKAYKKRTDNNPNSIDNFVNIYSENNLLFLKNYYRNNRDISYILAVAAYFLNIIDANVSSHLFNFNVDDNFSLNLRPNFENKNLIFAISIKL